MNRAALALIGILLGLGLFAGGLAWVLDTPRPPPGTPRVERLYLGLCATCHGADGRGSWRAAVFLIRPGNLADQARPGKQTDQYLFDIIKNARAPRDEWIIMFNEHAAEALRVERALHEGFFQEFGLSTADVAATPLAPTNAAYTSYLLAVAYGRPFHEAVAALLPCYWIYWEVGKALERAGSADPLYARWIGTYASDAFGDVVRGVLDATN